MNKEKLQKILEAYKSTDKFESVKAIMIIEILEAILEE